MNDLQINSDPRVEEVFENYPKAIRPKIEHLRKLIFETAVEMEGVKEVEETLKWGEPSYITKKGSTLRIDYKTKKPDQYAMYFKCTSKLIPSIKEEFGDLFNYETTRAIVFALEDEVPDKALKTCIRLALDYHNLKNKVNMGL